MLLNNIKKSNHLAIIGLAPRTMRLASTDSNIDKWTMNRGVCEVPQADVIFELHPFGELSEAHLISLNEKNVPIFMHDKHPEVERSLRFPIEDIAKNFGPWFQSSISYLIAFAIMLGYKKLSLYGIDMESNHYYRNQKPNVMYYIGLATGAGMRVYIPEEAELMKPELYSYSLCEILKEAIDAVAN